MLNRINKLFVYILLAAFSVNVADVYALPLVNDQYQPVPKFTDYIDDQLNPEQVKGFAHMAKTLEDHNVSSIPKELINFDHLADQRVELINEDGSVASTFNLSNVVKEIPDTGLDDYQFKAHGDQLLIEGYLYGKVVRKQYIPDIQLLSYVKDNDFIFILDKRGYAFVIDTTTLLMRSFKGILPVFKVYDNNQNTKVKLTGNLTPRFLSRGLQPFSEEDLTHALTVKDFDGKALIQAGDVVIEDISNGGRKLKAVLSREEILKLIKISFLRLSQTISLSTNEGFGRTLGEKVKYAIGESENDKFNKSPYERLQEIIEKYSLVAEAKNLEDGKSPSMRNFIEAAVHGFNRSDIILFTDRLQEYAKKSKNPRDQFTAEQWASDFKKIVDQAPIKLNELTLAAKTAKGIELKALENEIGTLEIAKTKGYFQDHYRALLKDNFVGKANIITDILPWYKRLNYSELAKFSTRISLKGLALYGTYKGLDYVLDESLSTQFYFASNYIYHQTVFAYLGHHLGYIYPLVGGMMLNMFGIVLIENFGKYSMAMLYRYTQLANKVGATKNALSANIHNALKKFALENKDASPYAKLVSMTMHLYAAIFFPIYVRIAQFLKQNSLFVSIGAGVSPFLKITPESSIGQALKMTANDSSFWTGFTNPFLNKEERAALYSRKIDAISAVALEKRTAKDMATRLATLIISYEQNIDPATLTLLVNDDLDPAMVNSILENPTKRQQWENLSKDIYFDLIDLMFRSGNKMGLKKMDPKLVLESITKIKSKIENYRNESSFSRFTNILANNFKIGITNFGQAVAGFGKADYYRLKTLKVGENIAGSVKSEFRSDQTIVAVLPALVGERARLDFTDPSVWAHGRDHLFFNTKSHGMDIAGNIQGHLVSSGPNQVLMYGKPEPISADYGPVLFDIVDNQVKEERLLSGMISYLKNAFHSASNAGGRALNRGLRDFTNIQVILFWIIVLRVFGLGQPFWTAFRGQEYFDFLAIPTYRWVWFYIQTANQNEGARINEQLALQKSAQEKISNALISNDDEMLLEGYHNLTNIYKENKSELEIVTTKIVKEASNKLKLNAHFKNVEELVKRIEHSEQGTLLLGIIIDLHDSLKSQDSVLIKQKVELLRSAMNSSFSPESIAKDLRFDLYEKARKLLNFSQSFSPIATVVNARVQGINTFVFGAVLTTILMIPLTIASIDPNRTTWLDLLEAVTFEFMFIGALYFTTGRRGAMLAEKWTEWFKEKYYQNFLAEHNSFPKKVVGKTGVAVVDGIKYTVEGSKGSVAVVGELVSGANNAINKATESAFESCAFKLRQFQSLK